MCARLSSSKLSVLIGTGKASGGPNPVLKFGAGGTVGGPGLSIGGMSGMTPKLGFGTQQGEESSGNGYSNWDQPF